MIYRVDVLDVHQKEKVQIYKTKYSVNAKDEQEAKDIVTEAVLKTALEIDGLDAIECNDVIIVYGTETNVISDVFFLLSVHEAANQFDRTEHI